MDTNVSEVSAAFIFRVKEYRCSLLYCPADGDISLTCLANYSTLHIQRLIQTCWTIFLLINYCSDMSQPQFLVIFRELAAQTYELPEDDQELRPKPVGAIVN